MDTVGVRELKTHLSRHLKRVRAGSRLVVTERGQAIATIGPVEPSTPGPEIEWARRMVAEGRAQWSGGKPKGSPRRITLTSGPTLAETVFEDRR
jgi:antitoxin (DNA-binding transcriptional repressor) of toxin-antitoxin stability system